MESFTHQVNISPGKLRELEKRIGNTPLYRLLHLSPRPGVEVYAKIEWRQLSGSVKARAAFNIIKQALISGNLHPGKRILDASSGNTGIAYAAVGAALGIPVTICLPENASKERKQSLLAYGAEIIYTSKFGSTDEAQEKARELAKSYPGKFFYGDQYGNENNWKAHYRHTAPEIIAQTRGRITHFVAGLGTTGTFTGTGLRLKEYNPDIKLISLQPDMPMHGLEGWKHLETANIPAIYRAELADEALSIDTQEAYAFILKAARKEGLLLSPSSAANLAGAIKIAEKLDRGVIVVIFPDSADKYTEAMNMII